MTVYVLSTIILIVIDLVVSYGVDTLYRFPCGLLNPARESCPEYTSAQVVPELLGCAVMSEVSYLHLYIEYLDNLSP
jgi:hypothetical protein